MRERRTGQDRRTNIKRKRGSNETEVKLQEANQRHAKNKKYSEGEIRKKEYKATERRWGGEV